MYFLTDQNYIYEHMKLWSKFIHIYARTYVKSVFTGCFSYPTVRFNQSV